MRQIRFSSFLAIFAFIFIILIASASLASAEHYSYYESSYPYKPYYYNYPYDKYYESFPSSHIKYGESPGFAQFPEENFKQKKSSRFSNSNFDSSSLNYDYRGPMFERQIIYTDDFSKDSSSRAFPFYSKSKDSLRHSISTKLIEKYVGATESLYANSKNNRVETGSVDEDTSYDYQGGFSFGKQRVFDAKEYGKDSYTSPHYYRPVYDESKGYYNWRY